MNRYYACVPCKNGGFPNVKIVSLSQRWEILTTPVVKSKASYAMRSDRENTSTTYPERTNRSEAQVHSAI